MNYIYFFQFNKTGFEETSVTVTCYFIVAKLDIRDFCFNVIGIKKKQ